MSSPAGQGERIGYIDFLKGLSCILMLIAHAMRVKLGSPDFITRLFSAMLNPAAQMFFFASGMNIILLQERYRGRRRVKLTLYYLSAAAVLFFLGYTYSFARLALGSWQIFQGIAATTALTFVLVRTRLSATAHILLAILFYLVYLQFRLSLEPVLLWYRSVLPPGPPAIHPDLLDAIRMTTNISYWQRCLFTNFSLLPWVSYVLLGATAFRNLREKPEMERRWALGFGAVFILGFLMLVIPHGIEMGYWYADHSVDALYRHVPHHVLTAVGACGLIWLACRRWYLGSAGPRKSPKRFMLGYTEFLGVASFLFFIFHWFVLMSIQRGWDWLVAQGLVPLEMNLHLRWIVACLLVLPLMYPAAWLGKIWSRRPGFVKQAVALMIISILLAMGMLYRRNVQAAMFVAFGSCFGYAYLYPVLRARLKHHFVDRYLVSKPKAA